MSYRLEQARAPEEDLAEKCLPKRRCKLHQRRLARENDGTALIHTSSNDYQMWQRGRERMIMNGWCSHQVRHLSLKYDLQTFSYLATLERSPVRNADHKRCSLHESCVAYNTDPNNYEIRHSTADCACQVISVPYDLLIEIIRKGDVPLVSIESGNTGGSEGHKLLVRARSRTSKYLAISHVWADGLGNPSGNALPSCQIERLRISLLAFPQNDGLFWMDTLRIPSGPDEQSLRLAQIDSMASIYKGASCSLLLDAELMDIKYSPKLASTSKPQGTSNPLLPGEISSAFSSVSMGTEIHARLACSIWMTRSWTLQEGKLPTNIAVQFKNSIAILGRTSNWNGQYREELATEGPYGTLIMAKTNKKQTPRQSIEAEYILNEASNDSIVHDQPLDNEAELTHSVTQSECECVDIALQRSLYDTFFARSNPSDLGSAFALVWDELAGRSTTIAEDVPLIITNLLNLEDRGLLDLDDTGQMFQTILLSLNRIPISLFFNTGPRQDQDNYHLNRWIPTKIGSFGLASLRQSMTILPSYLQYAFSYQSKDQDIMIYTMNSVLPLKAERQLSLGSPDALYFVQPSVATSDSFKFEDFASTCLIVERSGLRSREDIIRGACFYVQNRTQISSRWDSIRSRRKNTKWPNLNMTFYCPLKLRRVSAIGTHTALNTMTPTHTLDCMKMSCNLRVMYDPLPDFKPLRMRSGPKYGIMILIAYIVAMIAIFAALVVMLGLAGALIGILFIFRIGVPTGICIYLYCWATEPVIRDLAFWSYVRSFRATRRRQNRTTQIRNHSTV